MTRRPCLYGLRRHCEARRFVEELLATSRLGEGRELPSDLRRVFESLRGLMDQVGVGSPSSPGAVMVRLCELCPARLRALYQPVEQPSVRDRAP